jgi:hypothetical protein
MSIQFAVASFVEGLTWRDTMSTYERMILKRRLFKPAPPLGASLALQPDITDLTSSAKVATAHMPLTIQESTRESAPRRRVWVGVMIGVSAA